MSKETGMTIIIFFENGSTERIKLKILDLELAANTMQYHLARPSVHAITIRKENNG